MRGIREKPYLAHVPGQWDLKEAGPRETCGVISGTLLSNGTEQGPRVQSWGGVKRATGIGKSEWDSL